MQHIITLFGASNTGKTTTLNNLIDFLNNHHNEFSLIHKNPIRNTDSQATFKYKSGYIICITTIGDNIYEINKNLDYATQNNADILITASRTSGAGVDKLYETALSNNFLPIFISKNYENTIKKYNPNITTDEINEHDLTAVMAQLEYLLK